MGMIRRLLIANRGEIAARIAATAHRLGIETVGVYTAAESSALHAQSVDRAVVLPGITSAASYLDGDAVIDAALRTGSDAIHPGYGFLAESASFAADVRTAGLTWVGPTPDNIALLGDKLAAKEAARAAGVPTVPVFEVGGETDLDDIPLPVMVKAAAGGGGRGMRLARDRKELAAVIAAASREADSAFGDGRVFLEPYVEHGRHIEVQIIGDSAGTIIHLGERECSIQRRHQKIIEESPSPGIDDDTRRSLHEAGVALGRHVGYLNAGTVEFLVGPDGSIDFLEVNTRLQVEHPVTEAVTGLDLVELQLRVAAGESLGLAQDDVRFDGHAIEARIVAERPGEGWLPSTGSVRAFNIDGPVRVDAGVRDGSVVSADFDSLLAKVIAHAPTRDDAVRRLQRSLRSAQITGVATNVATLAAILSEPDFLAGATPTSYLDEHPGVIDGAVPAGDDRLALLLGAVFANEQGNRARDAVSGFAPSGFRNLGIGGQRQVWRADDEDQSIEYTMHGDGTVTVSIGQWPEPDETGALTPDERRHITVGLLERSSGRQVFELDGVRQVVDVEMTGDVVDTRSHAGSVSWTLRPRFTEHRPSEADSGPLSPLPGTVISVHIAPGDRVDEGHVMMVVEAMKMEHTIVAGSAATVGRVRVAVGDRVDAGELLVEMLHDD